MARLDWKKLLNKERERKNSSSGKGVPDLPWFVPNRTETERDFDRVLFSTPWRRLGDKTQVFPLEKNDSVRNRLTHSLEVANLARSIGVYLANSGVGKSIIQEVEANTEEERSRVRRGIAAMLGAVGLAHDLGNPPFGHKGEDAIRSWIKRNKPRLFKVSSEDRKRLTQSQIDSLSSDLSTFTDNLQKDFLFFEGNAQALRVVTRLQVVRDQRGLALTYGTLAAMMKYTVGADAVDKKGAAATRKIGFYASEKGLVQTIHSQTGLAPGSRHPLTFVMEACDDIAYSVIDAEDAVKKQLVSFPDLITWLGSQPGAQSDELVGWLITKGHEIVAENQQSFLSPSEQNDVGVQLFRVCAINGLVSAVIRAFEREYERIMAGEMLTDLLATSKAKLLINLLKKFDREHAYRHRRVLQIELMGYNTIHGLMDMLWRGISERTQFAETDPAISERQLPFAAYAYNRISENYRRVFETHTKGGNGHGLPIRYRELQLLTDMISGMTDEYAIDLHRELSGLNIGASSTCL